MIEDLIKELTLAVRDLTNVLRTQTPTPIDQLTGGSTIQVGGKTKPPKLKDVLKNLEEPVEDSTAPEPIVEPTPEPEPVKTNAPEVTIEDLRVQVRELYALDKAKMPERRDAFFSLLTDQFGCAEAKLTLVPVERYAELSEAIKTIP